MIGQRCKINGTEFAGLAVGLKRYLGCEDEYAVRYMDNSGPQERWFQVSQLSFSGANIVALREVA